MNRLVLCSSSLPFFTIRHESPDCVMNHSVLRPGSRLHPGSLPRVLYCCAIASLITRFFARVRVFARVLFLLTGSSPRVLYHCVMNRSVHVMNLFVRVHVFARVLFLRLGSPPRVLYCCVMKRSIRIMNRSVLRPGSLPLRHESPDCVTIAS
ncbi:hypothetical protein AMTR_s00002p00270310 [Amborella trichopoda]|uniref:Uncharacterized protein n=1 Tax=Amborella trichopoda TaxID=13333 RepID=W1P1Q3_AMBTC|nr:hypothetical protein AMTR_s00002p00270310 [Amborella trichopoda]